ncbi:MAG: hypothetical protein KatS3mg110_0290 [Pirellulaceae bacterium]|nr:MAG: hypothetical protein KatS3mg110_0290 [Pirellulaceae bacterium]
MSMPKHARMFSNMKKLRPTIIYLAVMLALAGARPAKAVHPVSVTEATVYVQRQKISVRIDVFVEDLYLFHNLQPDAQNRISPDQIETARHKHETFLLERFQMRDASGELLKGRPVGVDSFTMPKEGIALDDLMSYSYGFRFEYDLDHPLEFITFMQKLVDETTGIPAEMQLRVKQEGSETPYYATLFPGVPVTIRFSWDNPPLAPDASEQEWEQWFARQREELLGITSYSSVYSFIYIEDHEIRHEILVPLATLEASVLIPRADEAFLEVEEQPEAAEQIAAYYLAGNPVVVDGRRIPGRVQRVDFYGVDFRDFAQQAPKKRVSVASARVGIILVYPLEQPPRHVEITWDRFNRYISQVRSLVYAGDETLQFVFGRYGSEQTFRWDNPRPAPAFTLSGVPAPQIIPPRWDIPLVTVCLLFLMPVVAGVLYLLKASRRVRLAGAGGCAVLAALLFPYGHIQIPAPTWKPPELSDAEAAQIFRKLHAGLYRAFDLKDEEAVHDALALVVDGPLLRKLYLDVRRSLAMQEQGGAQSKIRRVSILDWQRLPVAKATGDLRDGSPAFAGRCAWQVEGTVEHWGHVHARTNQYTAHFVVAQRDGYWKIVDVELLSEERVQFETKLRGL